VTKRAQVVYGDWQTPAALADAALALVANVADRSPATVLEPTCGEGAFLVAAGQRFPAARLVGVELNPRYAATARAKLPAARSRVKVADFFSVEWEQELSRMRDPILVTGNPPWVTSAALGAIGAGNLPEKRNFKGLLGYDALTGKSNFDVSEWMILRLLQALEGRNAALAVLCKSQVARRVIEFTARKGAGLSPGGLFRIDTMKHFGAAVDAVLFVGTIRKRSKADEAWPIYDALDAKKPCSRLGVIDGVVVADADRFARTRHLAGKSDPEWRSGVKHDCAKIMELEKTGTLWTNGLGEVVDIENELVFPMLKSSDVANGRRGPSRGMIIPQRALGEDTMALRRRAPRAWAYLSKHQGLLDGRKSSIYKGRPPFSVFGVGGYSFAPWKVAVSGLYKRFSFALVRPCEERPVMLDDTCYFLPFDDEAEARCALSALGSAQALDFFSARVFWDAKRPISKAVLQALDLRALQAELVQRRPPRA